MDQIDDIIAQWNRERPDLDVAPMATIGRLARLARHLGGAHAECFEEHDLSAAGFDVLATLRRSGPPYALTVKDLLASTMVTSGTMTNRLDRLEDAGLVRREPNPEDGRGFVVQLTEAGHGTIDAAVSDHVANQHRLVQALTPDERATLDGLLRRWLAGFEDGAPSDR